LIHTLNIEEVIGDIFNASQNEYWNLLCKI